MQYTQDEGSRTVERRMIVDQDWSPMRDANLMHLVREDVSIVTYFWKRIPGTSFTVRAHTRAHTHTHTHVHTNKKTHTQANTYARTHTGAYTHTRTSTHTQIHAHTHT